MPSSCKHRLGRFFPAFLLAVAGCQENYVRTIQADGDTSVYSYGVRTVLFALVISILPLGLAAALWITKRRRLLAGPLLLLGLFALVFFVPSLFLDRVTVTPEQFSFRPRTFWWWSAQERTVRFDEIEAIQCGAVPDFHLVCKLSNGEERRIRWPTLLGAGPQILRRAKELGIRVTGEEVLGITHR